MPYYRIQDNVFGKARGRKPYCHTATTDNAALKHYLGFYMGEAVLKGEGSWIAHQPVNFFRQRMSIR
jgi:hypothetical protein